METKTKKDNIKKTVKKATKVETKKEIKTEPIMVIDYTSILNKIFYTLIVIACILGAILIVNVVKGGSTSTNIKNQPDNINNQTEETENMDYDVSSFDSMSTTDAMKRIAKGKTEIVYIGRATCGYCVKFLPTLKKAQKEFDYKTIYIDLEKMTSEDQQKLLTLDNEEKYITENFGYTPMVLIFKDGKLVQGWVGYAEYSSFAAFLEDNGIKK